MKWPLLAALAFDAHSAESFYAYVKSLMKSTASKEVSGVSISIGKANKVTIRMSRTEKIVTRVELELLAKEYKIEELELLQIFTKRKIGINYDNDNARRESDQSALSKAKEDARTNRPPRRTKKSGDKLLKPECNPRLHEESSILTDTESPF